MVVGWGWVGVGGVWVDGDKLEDWGFGEDVFCRGSSGNWVGEWINGRYWGGGLFGVWVGGLCRLCICGCAARCRASAKLMPSSDWMVHTCCSCMYCGQWGEVDS